MTDPTHPKFSDADDTEGHVLHDADADVAGRPEQAVTSPGPEEDDTEGHRAIANVDGQPGPAPDGLKRLDVTDEGEDTEGHRAIFADGGTEPQGYHRAGITDDEDDTEGHRIAFGTSPDNRMPD